MPFPQEKSVASYRPSRIVLLLLAGALAACSPPSATQQRTQAVALRQQGDYRAAIVALKSAAEATPNDGQLRYLLSQTYFDAGDSLPAASEARQALRLGYARGPALAALTAALVLQGQNQQALDASADGPDLPALTVARGNAWLALGKNAEARAAYEHVLAVAPAQEEARVDAQIGLGRLAIIDGKPEVARAAVDAILATHPRDTNALMFKAELLRAGARPADAIAVYDQVLAVSPQHRTAHVEKAYLAIGLRRYPLAQTELDAAAALTPGSLLLWYTQALLDYSRGQPQAAQDVLYKLLKAVPDHMPSLMLAGAVSLKLGNYYQAEHYLTRYVEHNPANLDARKMLASALLGSGHADDARTALAPALKAGAGDAKLLALAGESNLRTKRYDAAADLFGQASALDTDSAPFRTALGLSQLGKGDTGTAVTELQAAAALDKNSTEAGVALVRAQLRLGQRDAALASALALEKAQPDKALVHALKAQVLAAKGEPAKARASFAHAQALDPAYFQAALGLAQLAIEAKQPAQARQVLLDFLAKNKTSVQAMAALATLAHTAGNEAEVTNWLEQAAAVDPRAISSGVNLVGQYIRTGHADKALKLARMLQVNHPDNVDLLDLLGKAQLASGDNGGALESYKALAQALPRSPTAKMQIAALRLSMGNATQGEEDLRSALAMQPDFPAAQLALAELYVRRGAPDLALQVAQHIQRAHPLGSAGFQLEGNIQMAKRQPAAALAAFERAYALTPTNELVVMIDGALRQANRAADADRRLDAWIKAHPADVRVPAYRAQLWSAAGDTRRAATQLEDVVRRQPGNVAALNNLALAYQALNDPRAVATAEAALKRAGDKPPVMDTLAWILVGKGDAARAVPLLRKASTLAPGARDIRYHLAAALAASGDKTGARKEVDAALAGNPQFAQLEDARKLQTQLNNGG